MIYLDHAATTPLRKEALEAISRTTLENAETFEKGMPVEANIVK